MNNEYAIYMEDICKSFAYGKIKANQNLTLKVKQNEIHAIIGENGAGKSTLMSILFGLYKADSGSIYVNGNKVAFNSAKDASRMKIGMVHQHFKLVNNYSVLQNIILGSEKLKFGFLDIISARRKIKALIKQYDFNINVGTKVSKLTIGQQQKVEILKLLYRDASILIFDEPTAVLSDDEIESFLQMTLNFKKQGKTSIIISHKLKEIKSVSDSCTIIRLGKLIGDYDVADLSIEKMAELMVGRHLVDIEIKDLNISNVVLKVNNLVLDTKANKRLTIMQEKIKQQTKAKILELKASIKGESNIKDGVNKQNVAPKAEIVPQVKKINFEIHAGEIFAVAGVEGNGQSILIEKIAGLQRSHKNSILFASERNKAASAVWKHQMVQYFEHLIDKNKVEKDPNTLVDISYRGIKHRYDYGMSFIPEDRHKHGLFLDLSILFNAVGNSIWNNEFNYLGLFRKNHAANFTSNIINTFDVRGAPWINDPIRSLSGGNQQKFIVGREMLKNHKLIIFAQPTRGLDVGAIEFIQQRIIAERDQGKAILLVSYELDEIYKLADTIAIMSDNAIVGVGPKEIMTRQKVGVLMATGNKAAEK